MVEEAIQATSHLTPTEIKLRVAAETSLYEFVKQAWSIVEPDKPFIDGWHIQAICAHLQAMLEDNTPFRNLMINVPPGFMKSLLCSVFFPAWVWIHKPSTRFVFASYDLGLSTRDSVKCRQIISSTWYQRFWASIYQLTGDQNEKRKFENDKRGWRIATSVGGGLGEHPDFFVIDDAHHTKKFDSPNERKKVTDWYDSTVAARGRIRGSRRIVIMQRLYEDDLCGHLLAKNRKAWVHLCLPVRFEKNHIYRTVNTPLGWSDPRTVEGELLWPAAFPESEVAAMETELGSAIAEGQLQQRPVKAGGDLFKADYFEIVPAAPYADIVAWVRYWDKAYTESGGAETASVLMGKSKHNVFYIETVTAVQFAYLKREAHIKQTAQLDAQRFGNVVEQRFEQEPSAGKESAQRTVAMLAGFLVSIDKVKEAKEARATPFAAQCEAGNVKLVAGPWNQSFIDQAVVFPRGKFKDKIDAAAGAFTQLTLGSMGGAIPGELLASGDPEDKSGSSGLTDKEIDELPDFLQDILRETRKNKSGRPRGGSAPDLDFGGDFGGADD